MEDMKPTRVTNEAALEIIEKRVPLGKFYCYEGRKVIGIDNETGDAWTEEFGSLKTCKKWLTGQ